jgi:acyl-CoA thioester hydrolase
MVDGIPMPLHPAPCTSQPGRLRYFLNRMQSHPPEQQPYKFSEFSVLSVDKKSFLDAAEIKMRRKKQYFKTFPDDPPPISISVRHRLTFSEVDALAIAWHGHYPKFFELAHTELMRRVGLTYEAYKQSGIGAPIVQCHVDYFAPLLLDEECTIQATLSWSDGARLNVSYEVRNSAEEIAATGYTVQMFFDLHTREPFIFPPPLIEKTWERWKNREFIEVF